MIRIQLVDDHTQFRQCVRDLIERQPDMQVIGEFDNGADVLQACAQASAATLPDVVLMDLRMRGVDGIAATRRLHAQWPTLAILALSSHDDPPLVRAFTAAGGSGYMLKGDPLPELLHALRRVAAGDPCYSSGLSPSALPAAP